MRDYSIYQIQNNVNNKKYIGKAIDSQRRWKEHCLNSKTKKSPLYNAIRKYGIENFSFTILFQCKPTEESLCFHETRLIQEHNTMTPGGYNLTTGGDGGDTFSFLSESRKNEKRQKLRKVSNFTKIHKSPYDWWFEKYGFDEGMRLRKEHIEKIKVTKKHKINTDAYKKLQSIRMKEVKSAGLSDQHRKRLSEHNSVRYKLDEIKKQYMDGKTVSEIAVDFNVSEYTIDKKLQLLGLVPKQRDRKYIEKYT